MATLPWENDPLPEYPPVYIVVGVGRSGTTYLGAQMKTGLDIGSPTEPKLFEPLYRRLDSFGDLAQPDNLRRLCQHILDSKLFAKMQKHRKGTVKVEEILERVKESNYRGVAYASLQLLADKQGKSRLGYKDPYDVQNLDFLSRLLPTAKFIHIVRDGRDVAFSTCRMDWGATNLVAGAQVWADGVEIGMREGALLGERYRQYRLEDLVHDTANVAGAIADFVNDGNDPEETARFVRQIEETKKPGRMNPWKTKLTQTQIRRCEAIAGKQLEAAGYELMFDGKATISPLTTLVFRAIDVPKRAANAVRFRRKAGARADLRRRSA